MLLLHNVKHANSSSFTRCCFCVYASLLDMTAINYPVLLENTTWFLKRWYAGTSKAAWTASTTFIVLIVPLIISMDREQQVVESENQQLNALTGGQKN